MFEDERTDGIIVDDSDDLVVGGDYDDYSAYEEEPEEVEDEEDDEFGDDYDVYEEEPDNEEVDDSAVVDEEDDYDVYGDYGEEPENDEVDDYSAYDEGGVAEPAGNVGETTNVARGTDVTANIARDTAVPTGTANIASDTAVPIDNTDTDNNVSNVTNTNIDATATDTVADELVTFLRGVVADDFTDDLIKAAVLSAQGKLKNDVNKDTIIRGSHDVDFEFGYSELPEEIMSVLDSVSPESEETIRRRMEAGILSRIRNISHNEYNADYVRQDKELIKFLSTRTFSQSLKDAIADTFDTEINSALNLIKSRFSYIMEGAFGIDSYRGVYTLQDMSGVVERTAKKLEPHNEFAKSYIPVLKSILDVDVRMDRQFNLKAILQAYKNGGAILYFPYKMLEFVAKCGLQKSDGYSFTRGTKVNNYTNLSASTIGTKSKYIDNIIDYFKVMVLDYLFIVLRDLYETEDETVLEAKVNDFQESGNKDYIRGSLDFFASCVSNVVVLESYTTSKDKSVSGADLERIIEFSFKICSKLKNPKYSNQKFINSLIEVSGRRASDMADVEETVCTVEDNLGFTKVDLKYTFDAEKVNSRPAFAYKALEAVKTQGGSIDWQNILLGRDLSNNLVTSGMGSKIQLQNNQVHWIFSGSRSGKGVMCYNIFATAIASQVPIFYLDRKPDTAITMSELCPDMFIVNGGQWDETIDTAGVFSPSTYNFNIPDYLESCFIKPEDRFDFVYFRSVMLVLSMFDYADTYKTSELGMKMQSAFSKGVMLVLDEFSNFIKDFLADTKPLSASSGSWLASALSVTGIEKAIQGVADGVSKAKLNFAKVNNKKDVSEEEIAMAERELAVAQAKEFPLDKMYWSAIADGYQAVKDSLSGKKDAAGAVAKSMQIFCIGQDFSKVETALNNPDWYNTGASGNQLKFNKSNGIIPLVSLLSSLFTDVITGYQPDRESYLAQGDSSYRTKSLLNQSRRCFAYKKINLTASSLHRITHTVEAEKGNEQNIKGYLNSWIYFKPFLILNNAVEPPVVLQDKNCNPDAKVRENMRKGLVAAPDGNKYPESQFVGQCLSSCEKAGLSWSDLLGDNDDGTGHLNRGIGFEGYISELCNGIPTDSMRLSGDIANEFIRTVYNYQGTWREFVCDFRPEYIITTKGFNETGESSVVSRLSQTFFLDAFKAYNPAEVIGSKLGSLLDYYNVKPQGQGSRVEDGQYQEDIYIGEEFEPENSGAGSPVAEQSFGNSHQSSGADEWTDEERRKAAILLFDFYISGVESENPQKAANLKSDNRIKLVIVNSIVQMLQSLGY